MMHVVWDIVFVAVVFFVLVQALRYFTRKKYGPAS